MDCIGIVRGEKPQKLSSTLSFCIEQGMQLEFTSREEYKVMKQNNFSVQLKNKYGDHILIPEGGFSVKGKKGASLIWQFIDTGFTHIALPVGTATTFAGIVDANTSVAEIIGFGVLKNLEDIDHRFNELEVGRGKKYVFNNDYHFEGYAKKTDELISFINEFYLRQKIPLDFVYTGKMMFGIDDLVEKKYFSPGSRILCVHTGGLQGNQSLPHGTLTY
jgi:1-aminocyclopropane-1-carboxylate deaminase/D-cysteine desulfhydrase-like pyridoxal-dependent ACC family enzyme